MDREYRGRPEGGASCDPTEFSNAKQETNAEECERVYAQHEGSGNSNAPHVVPGLNT